MELFSTLWRLVLFSFSIIIFAVSPGFVILSFLKINLTKLERLVLSLGMGITVSSALYFFSGLLKMRFLADFMIGIAFIIFIILLFKKKYPLMNLKSLPIIVSLLLIIFLSLFQSSSLPGCGYDENSGTIKIRDSGDSMWIISLSRELSKNVPPTHPGFAPEVVTNYHYFTHLFIGTIYRFTQIPIINLYYNYFLFFFSLFLGLSAFVLGRKLFKSYFFADILVVLTYVAGSFSYLLPFWLGKNFLWGESTFWSSQTFGSILNPSVILSLSLFYLIIFCLYKYLEEKERMEIPLVILAGVLISFKVYAGIIVLLGLGAIAMLNIFKKKYDFLIVYFFTLLISLLVFLPVSGKDSSSFLTYAPFWFLHTMVENKDRLNIPEWALKEQYYWATNNLFAVARLRLAELFLFIVGNLGIRVVGFFIIPLYFFKKLPFSRLSFFLLTTFITGMTIPLFFIQKGSVGNTIQFFYYSLIIGNILTVFVLKDFFSRNKYLTVIGSLIIILLSLPTTVGAAASRAYFVLDKSTTESLLTLKKITKPDDIILLPPTGENLFSMYVSVVSERNTYYSYKLMAENTLKNNVQREKELSEFFNPGKKKDGLIFQKEFISKYHLNTLYLKKEEEGFRENIYIPYSVFFKNDSALILKFL